MIFRFAITLVVASALLSASPAAADKLLMLSTPETLTEATRQALAGWEIEIVAIDSPSLGTDVPDAYEHAQNMARENQAAAVIWLAPSNGRMALWIYEQDEGLLATRRVDNPDDLTAEAAAALGLSIKTVLRHSQIAPPQERLSEVEHQKAERPHSFLFAVTFAARVRSVGGTTADARIGVDAQYTPPQASRLSFYLQAMSGPGVDFENPLLEGRLDDTTLAAGGGLRLLARQSLAVHARAGLELHWTRLGGTIVDLGRSASVSRLNPAIGGGLRIDIELTPIWRIGAHTGASANLRTQDYNVFGERALSPPTTEFLFGIHFGLATL